MSGWWIAWKKRWFYEIPFFFSILYQQIRESPLLLDALIPTWGWLRWLSINPCSICFLIYGSLTISNCLLDYSSFCYTESYNYLYMIFFLFFYFGLDYVSAYFLEIVLIVNVDTYKRHMKGMIRTWAGNTGWGHDCKNTKIRINEKNAAYQACLCIQQSKDSCKYAIKYIVYKW